MKDDPEIPNEFVCAMCGNIFTIADGWDNDKALNEAQKNGFDLTECMIVCDDCYKRTVWI